MFALRVVRTGQKVFSGIGTFSGDAFDERSTAEGTGTEPAIFSIPFAVIRLQRSGRFIVLPFQKIGEMRVSARS